jgi:hypothetical protein
MVQTRLTKLGKMFLLLMLLFYGAAVTSQSGLLLLFRKMYRWSRALRSRNPGRSKTIPQSTSK